MQRSHGTCRRYMVPGTSSSPKRVGVVPIAKHRPGIRTRVLLLTSVVGIITATMASSLFIVRSKLRQHVQENLVADLQHSVETFKDLEARKLFSLERENALLASLPSLKAVMTTSDPRTIADDAVDFWKTSGNDLFALTDADGHVLTAYAQGSRDMDQLKLDLQRVIASPVKHYLLSDGHLYEYSIRPLYFGSETNGTLLGHVISGYAIDHGLLLEVGRGAGAEAAFFAGDKVLVSTLTREKQERLTGRASSLPSSGDAILRVEGERFLAVGSDLALGADVPLRLVVMKSFDEADREEQEINRLLLGVSLLAITVGALLMVLLARMVTLPLELLTDGVQAFGEGDQGHSLPVGGTQEVRSLSSAFAAMRDEIQKTNRTLLETERLATIGRMASSISHDLRHYLAAVYANAEFLASPVLPASERLELFEDIRLAVNGTTDMLDSLLIFGRTGTALQRAPTAITGLVERAMALVRMHPDAEHVSILLEASSNDTTATVDSKQVERAVYNLLLNACQSARENVECREVWVSVYAIAGTVSVTITDSGMGVAEGIRESLFDPFVSQGKLKGTGLGLTLAWRVAREHDGTVELVGNRPGETIFRFSVARQIPEKNSSTKPMQNTILTS
jgi:signal transduction histidine kinase